MDISHWRLYGAMLGKGISDRSVATIKSCPRSARGIMLEARSTKGDVYAVFDLAKK